MTNTYLARQTHQENRTALAQQALGRALRVRQRLRISLWDAVCAHDVAAKLGIEVAFQNIPSMEGMYCQKRQSTPLIVLSSERPVGRQNFNAAHEIGHHEHGDGTRIDEFLDGARSHHQRRQKSFDPIEFRADRFASFLLMPKSAVDRAFAIRGFQPQDCEPAAVYAVAGVLGVGYQTLIEHLCFSLSAISQSRADELRGLSLSRLRASIVGHPVKNVKVVDEHWGSHAVDALVGDFIVIPSHWQTIGNCFVVESPTGNNVWQPGVLARATRQGEGALVNPNTDTTIRLRVSRQDYVGRAIYRHLDDPDEDEQASSDGAELATTEVPTRRLL